MDILTSKRQSNDYLWTSFCKNKTSVKIISRNGISTSKSSNAGAITNSAFGFTDNEVNNLINDATDEIFKSNDKFTDVLSGAMKCENMISKSRSVNGTCQKVVTLQLSPMNKYHDNLVRAKLPDV